MTKRVFRDPQGRRLRRGDGHRTYGPALRTGAMFQRTPAGEPGIEPEEGGAWKQPGRRFGPSPIGPDHPKLNKVTDRDGNPRIMPLTADQRLSRYYASPGAVRRVRPNPEADDDAPLSPYHRAALLGLTMRQARRLRKKANRTSPHPRTGS